MIKQNKNSRQGNLSNFIKNHQGIQSKELQNIITILLQNYYENITNSIDFLQKI